MSNKTETHLKLQKC